MNISVESVSNVEKKIKVTIPEVDVQKEIDKAYKNANRHARIPGFRSGKIPRSMLEKRYGASIESEVYQNLVKTSVATALEEQKLKAIRVTEISEPSRKDGEGFSYTANVEVKPEFKPQSYTAVKIEKTKFPIENKQIEDALQRLQESQSTLEPKEGVDHVVAGDYASMDVALKGKEPSDQLYEVANANGQKDLDACLLSMKVGETKDLTIPATEGSPAVEVVITLKGAKTKVLPKLSDDFAKSVGPFENLEALKTQIKEDLEKEAQRKAKQEDTKKVLEAILKSNPIDLPKSLVDNELAYMKQGVERQMSESGLQGYPKDYSEEKLVADLRPDAERRVHEQLVLEAIAEAEKIEVTDQEVLDQISETAKSARIPVAELRAYYEKAGRLNQVAFQIMAEKTLDFLLSKATIKE